MGDLVYNLRGSTEDDPCPTEPSRFFKEPKCTRGDYQAWRTSARALYLGALNLLFAQLINIETAAGETAQQGLLRPLVDQYAERYNRLPKTGSAFFPSRNAQLIAEVVALMLDGEGTLAKLRAAIGGLGATPVPLLLPAKPATVQRHGALRAYAFPLAAGLSGVAVLSLTVWAFVGNRDAAQ